ncbi:hypothetical protein [Ralstonia sp. Ralssp110]|jgi:hypothetical protein|uniref:hypothetical protein n=1 Tax=Ralstonia sp. Ralssp110 TaxID=3243004 RepID=UPI0039B58062
MLLGEIPDRGSKSSGPEAERAEENVMIDNIERIATALQVEPAALLQKSKS